VRAAAATSNLGFWPTVYRLNDDVALLVNANLSTAKQDSTAIVLDFAALGFSGEYTVELLNADSIDNFGVRYLGRTTNGRIQTESLPRFAVQGFLFTRGERSPAMARALDEALQVASAFFDQRPPDQVADLEVAPAASGLELTWAPAADNDHVAGYRIYRSSDPTFKETKAVVAIGEAYEETRYRDLALSPGETWSYAVAALDVAGNVGSPSMDVQAKVPAGERSFSFSDSSAVRRSFVPLSGNWSVHDSTYGHGCKPEGIPLAQSLLSGVELADVDLSVKISSPAGGPFAGGILCRANARGEGYVLYLGGMPGSVILARLADKTAEPLATAYYPFVTSGVATHTLRLVARGAELAGYCDDRPLVTITDATYSRGQVGLVAMQGHVHFDNLTLSSAGKAPSTQRPNSRPRPNGGTF
jgi:hypothetical protein